MGQTILRMKVYGAWLYEGEWDGESAPPGEDWKLVRMMPGRFQKCPEGLEPQAGQVTLLMQGEHCLVVTPE